MGLIGDVVSYNEVRLRSLPKTIVLRQLAEISRVIGVPLPGSSTIRFEYLRCD